MWTIGFQPNDCASPVLPRKTGKCSPSPTYPPATTTTKKGFIILIKGKGEWGRGLAFPAKVPPCGERAARAAVPDQKAGPVFFAPRTEQGRGKKSSGPAGLARAFDPGRRGAAFAESQGRDGGMGLLGSNIGMAIKQAPFRRGGAAMDRNGFRRIPAGKKFAARQRPKKRGCPDFSNGVSASGPGYAEKIVLRQRFVSGSKGRPDADRV